MARAFCLIDMGENPFRATPPATREMREPEHLHGMKDVKAYLLRKIQTDLLPGIQKIDQSLKEHPDTSPKRFALLEAKRQAMERARQVQQAAKECDRFECKPWSYEAFLLEDLFSERAKPEPDQEHINHVRGLLRAGSVLAKDTLSNGQEAHIIKTDAEALGLIGKAQRTEMEYWDWRMRMATPRHADPELAQELEEYREKDLHELELAARLIEQHTLGEGLETAVRTIEDIHQRLHQLYLDAERTLQDIPPSALASIQGKQAKNQRTQWRDAYLSLRPLRDFLYYRRLYPIQATASLINPPSAQAPSLKHAM